MEVEHFSNHFKGYSLAVTRQWLQSMPAVSLFNGFAGSSAAYFISDIFVSSGKTVLVLVENSKKADILCEECQSFVGKSSVCVFSSRDNVPYNLKSPFGPIVENRFTVLSSLLQNQRKIVIAAAEVLMQKIPSPSTLFHKIIRLHIGQEISLETLSEWLFEIGFHKENAVEDLGTFCIRGGIVDIYPLMTDNPVRLEFCADTIESIREFNVFTQKSTLRRSSIEIFPMKEYLFDKQQITAGLESLKEYCASMDNAALNAFHKLEHRWKMLGDYEGIEWFLHWFEAAPTTILDYLPADSIIVWNDILPIDRRLDDCQQNYYRHLQRLPEPISKIVSPPQTLLVCPKAAEENLSLFTRVFIQTTQAPHDAALFCCSINEQPQFPPEIKMLSEHLQNAYRQGYETIILCPNVGYAERLFELIEEQCPFIKIFIGYLARGFADEQNKRLFYTTNQIFKTQPRVSPFKRIKSAVAISGFDALSPQDYVVHVDHGIGQFIGIERVKTADVQRDCMVIRYQDNARLYVPIEDFPKVQKYIGKESVAPALSKLGSSSWERLKNRTRDSLKEMASELIELYAKRQFLEGIAFSPDSVWQKEFEDAFMYEETADQLRAIAEVKQDMEKPKPMDRLICGDVGFGKTEVAMRAAFKAVMDGYQVAVLAPTTILASQHYTTFTQRMAGFSPRIAMLSRFLKPKEQKKIIDEIKHGSIDIVIATHRILSNDIEFKNLGLLIIDEEQRFGVKHKEKLKQYRHKVDVLSMTATPIPRTLHLSLIGARDLSIINTPPLNRLPIRTMVCEYHDELIKQAIENELERGGQVYFVNNRIKNLSAIAEKIETMIPRVRVMCAHGQMDEAELELIMKEFTAGRIDVLVSTVIIENGLDIPNVNTIIVNRADTMGMAQLYQLRGRVGRSSEQAFAYLLTPPISQVDETALRRLKALEQYTELGSGFQIAMRDLEIRGAGNILGIRQHGFIAAVGFEMYCRLLKEAIEEIKTGRKVVAQEKNVVVDIALEAFIPTEYISDGATRISVYQQLASIREPIEFEQAEKDLLDRFGPLPSQVFSLLQLLRIKTLAAKLGATRVAITSQGTLELSFELSADDFKKTLKHIYSRTEQPAEIVYEMPIRLKYNLSAITIEDQALEALLLLEKLSTDTKDASAT